MQFSQRILQVKPSATLSINAKAAELKAQGHNVISLAAGEPDFLPPSHVLAAAKDAVDQGWVKYTPVPGLPELRLALAEQCSQQYGVDFSQDMVILTNGGKQGLYNLMQCLLDPGQEVLIPAPYWVSYPDMASLADAVSVIVPTQAQNGFKLTIQDLQAACTDKARILILNSPSNPTGCHYSQAELDAIMEWAIHRGLFVISDEIYDQLVYPPAQPSTVANWLHTYPEQVAICNGFSKSFALTGWRLGYVLAHPELIKKMSTLQGQSTSNVCVIAQKAALAAVQGSHDFLQQHREAYAARRDLALERIRAWPGVQCPKPDGAFYLFPKCDSLFSEAVPDSTALCAHILDQAQVALVPGVAFGDDRCLRISYAIDTDTLIQALDRIGGLWSQ